MGFLRQLLTGRRLVNSLLSGEFDDSAVGQQLSVWFRDRPAREEQRQIFVQVTLGLHCPSGVVADRLMHCIMEVWGGHGARFGDILAQEIGRLITFDAPKSGEQAEQQRAAKQGLEDLKTRLRTLDAEIESRK
jgi:hypothetical protein